MSVLRTALLLAIAGTATSALAEQITCESHQNAAEACGTVQPGSSVRLVRQISNSPCIQGRSWDSSDDSIWVSQGCRAVFDVQPPPGRGVADENDGYQQPYRDEQRAQPRYAEQQDESNDDDAGRGDDDRGDYEGDDSRQADEDQPRDGHRSYDGRHYAHADSRRESARQSCIERTISEYSFAPDEVTSTAVRWIGEGRISVSLDTPNGPMACTVERDGDVRLIDRR